MKTFIVTEYYEGRELGVVYAKNLKQARSKANTVYAGLVAVREYKAHLERLELGRIANNYN